MDSRICFGLVFSVLLLGSLGWQAMAQPESLGAVAQEQPLPAATSGKVSPPLACRILGTLRWPQGQEPPQTIRLRLQPAASESTHAEAKVQDLACVLEDTSFSCNAPEGQVDAKLVAEGFVPLYLWGLALSPESVHRLDPWILQAGASVAGWVVLEEHLGPADGSSEDGVPKVTLERQASGWQGDPSEKRRMELRRLETSVDARGFFQLVGVEPGGFRLRVEKEGYVPLVQHDLKVVAGEELLLGEPLVLYPPVQLEVVVSPPTQPHGEPWQLQLSTLEKGTTVLRQVVSAEVPVTGTWQGKVETFGNHKLVVLDAREQPWAERWLNVGPGLRPTFMEIPLVEVEGHIRLGDEPLAARLVFGSTQGTRQVAMVSDDEGRFEGFLPHEGKWPVDLVAQEGPTLHQALPEVEVERRPGKRVVRLDIELPATALLGEVVKDGEPVADAKLAIFREQDGARQREGVAAADEKGEFALRGAEPGILWVHAYRGQAASPWIRVDVVEGLEPARVRIELEDKIELSGLVLSPDGEVPGADVRAIPAAPEGDFGLIAEGRSKFDGSFTLSLAPGVTAVDLVVTAPGYARQLLHLPLQAEGPNQAMVQVEAESGTVVFRAPGVKTKSNPRKIVSSSTLHYNGTTIPLSYLYTLSGTQGRLAIRQAGLGLTEMPLGEYRLCDTQAGSCESGYLAPQGELVLNDPPAAPNGP